MIKYIVEIYTSKRDVNGNRYHTARIISTESSNVLVVRGLGCASDAVRECCKSGVHHTEIYQSFHDNVSKREVLKMGEWAKAPWPHDVTAKMLLDLHKVQS